MKLEQHFSNLCWSIGDSIEEAFCWGHHLALPSVLSCWLPSSFVVTISCAEGSCRYWLPMKHELEIIVLQLFLQLKKQQTALLNWQFQAGLHWGFWRLLGSLRFLGWSFLKLEHIPKVEHTCPVHCAISEHPSSYMNIERSLLFICFFTLTVTLLLFSCAQLSFHTIEHFRPHFFIFVS